MMKRNLQALFLALFLTTGFFSAYSQVSTDFSGSLSTATVFDRPRMIGEGTTSDEEFYIRQLGPSDLEAGTISHNYLIQAITPEVTGSYSITVTLANLTTSGGMPDGDTFLFLYADNFSAATPLANLLVANDDSRNGTDYSYLSRLTGVSLTAGTTYYIVATSFNSGSTGSMNFNASGPGEMLFPTLPVKWLGFTAARQGNSVVLNWSTATEQNTREYVVQQSTNGRHWKSLGVSAAAGYSSTVKQYVYQDTHPVPAVNYYRILQWDNDGRKSYSQVAMVDLSPSRKSMQLYPNPVVNGQLTVKLDAAVRIELYNAAGASLLQKPLPAGSHQLSLQSLPKGVYIIKAGSESQTVIVQ